MGGGGGFTKYKGRGCEGARGVKKISLRIQIENSFIFLFSLGGRGGGEVEG